MNPTYFLLLLPVLSAFIIAISHSLAADGGASVLDQYGITARLPKSAVAVALLLCTGAGPLVDTLVNGQDWPHAVAAAALALVGGLFGAVRQHSITATAVATARLASRAGPMLVLVFCLVFGLAACPNAPSTPTADADASSVVEAGAQVADGICKFIDGVDNNGIVRTICATIPEVADVIGFILTLRTSDAGAAASCAPLPGTTFCATSAERAKAVVFLSHVRAARLLIDGGVR